ncbi:MAG TPA: glycine cleavage T C-terminal barrel domain-containing protein [Pirellulales bacterium]|nr:glycine cleavage T C-terminal barrel domain-containing protein [Pirellulales bacterium]
MSVDNSRLVSDDGYAALTGAVGLIDLAERTRIELSGEDRAAFLHNLSTNDIKRLAAGAGCEAFWLNARGHVLAHGFVICRPASLVIETAPGQEESLLAHLNRYLIREKVELHPRTAEWGAWLLAGPQAADCLSRALGISPPVERLASIESQWQGRPLFVVRVEMTQPGGFLVVSPRETAAETAEAFVRAGAARCSPAALEAARIEAGFPYYGRDITGKTLPQEVARDKFAISFTKGCYIGQETVARIDALGHVNKTLVGVRFEGGEVPSSGTELFAAGLSAAGQVVGEVTSAVFSPRLGSPLALAYVRRGSDRPGVQLESPLGGAEVVALPLG